MEIIQRNGFREIVAAEGKYIHRKHTENYFTKGVILDTETLDDFEEVDTVPEIVIKDDSKTILYKEQVTTKVQELFFKNSISSQINSYNLSNKEALAVKEFYPEWSANSISIKKGDKYQYGDDLFEADQDHTSQANWSPGNMSSLWHEVVEDHEGTLEDPIPYNVELNPLWQGMILELGKYYTQRDLIYKCTRDSGIPLTQELSGLVGHYVELA